jgi:hypothetical protein
MAKASSNTASSTVTAATPTTSSGSATIAPGSGPPSSVAPKPETLVLDWEAQQGGASAFEGEPEPQGFRMGEAEVADPGDIDLSGGDQPVATRREVEERAEPEKPADPSRAEKRRKVFDALERSKVRLAAESAAQSAQLEAKTAKDRAEAAEAKLAKATSGSLADKLSFLGLSQEELTDAIIMNGGKLVEAAKKDGASTPELSELRQEIAAARKLAETAKAELDKERESKQQAETAKAVEQSRQAVSKLIEKEPVPLVRALKAHDRVVRGAWEAWNESGKSGQVSDYVIAAAEVIEEQLASEYPDLAKLSKNAPAEEGEEAEAPAPRRIARPTVGRRTPAPRTPSRDSLHGVMDGDERTRIILKEMGLR